MTAGAEEYENAALMDYAVAAGDAIVAASGRCPVSGERIITLTECRHGVPTCLGPCFFCVNGPFGSGRHGGQAGPLPGGKLHA